MEFFHGAKAVRLRSQHNKYLIADDDEETVRQSSNGSSRNARWAVEFVEAGKNKNNAIRLKSCHTWKYLCASDDPFLLGWTGRKIVQASPRMRLDPSVEWEPVSEGSPQVKLRSLKGRGMFLRANGMMPPWRNSVTHDLPSRTSTQDWILWEVEILENDHTHQHPPPSPPVLSSASKKNLTEEDQGRRLSSNYVNGDVDEEDDKEEEEVEVEARESSASSRSISSEVHSSGDHGVTVSSPRSVISRTSSSKLQDVESISRVSSFASSDGTPDPMALKSSAGALPPVHKLIAADTSQSAHHSNSFTNLKSMLDDVQRLIDGGDGEEAGATTMISPKKPTSLEVRIAKQTLKDIKDLDFRSISSSENRLRKIQNSISVLYHSNDRRLRNHHSNLLNIQLQIGTLKDEYYSSIHDLSQYAALSDEKSAIKSEFQKDVARARVLETKEEECSSNLATAYARRAELLRQLEEIEKDIEENQKAQVENAVEMEQLVSIIGQKSRVLKEMESKEKPLQYRKILAEKKLEQVEQDWAKIKYIFSAL
ncbi:hypothetical protein Dimus_016353 [Dionaea muscipula]